MPGKNLFEYAEGSQRALGHLRHSGTQALEALSHLDTRALRHLSTRIRKSVRKSGH